MDAAAVKRMTDALARRGPDGEGVECWPTAILGHRRLAIFDLSEAGHQPMVSPDGEIGVVFNGAIYNFRELRRELEGRGYSFRSATDTEVLVHGFREWGIHRLVERIHGMFAFALWDNSERRLFLVRDRLGVKPLAFVVLNGEIAFGSTPGALRAAGRVAEIDDGAMLEYLRYGFVTDERSIYRGVLKVPAASILEWHGGQYSIKRYWSAIPQQRQRGLEFEDAVTETERLFMEAVSLRLQADVPVGVLLSSGIDSSLVCWAVAKLGARIRAYTVGVPGDPWDETSGAQETGRAVGIEHSILGLAAPDISNVDRLVEAYAEPFACSSALGMLSVSRAVADEATVLLTGDGGDDAFLGYPRNRNLWLAQRLAGILPIAAGPIWSAMRRGVPRIGPLRRARAFADYSTRGIAALDDNDYTRSYYFSNQLLGDRLNGRLAETKAIRPTWSVGAARTIFEDHIARAQRTHFVGEYLPKVDGATMYYGLEARSPFLDQRLWEFAVSLPVGLRLRHFHLKSILRAIARRRIGSRTAERRKRGFGIPVHRWLAKRWYEAAQSVWENSILQQEGWINAGAVMRSLAEARKNGVAPLPLWYLFVLEKWLRNQRSVATPNLEKETVRKANLDAERSTTAGSYFSAPTSSSGKIVGFSAATAKQI